MADSDDEGKKEGMLLRALKLVAKIDWPSRRWRWKSSWMR